MERRTFLETSGCALLAMGAQRHVASADVTSSPNVLIIMTDQQFGDGMSCVIGREYLHTPHMDALAENGMRFTRAYSPNPLCMPMRASMITGHYPHRTSVQTNGGSIREPDRLPIMGRVFKDAGYETAYFGKWHIPLKGEHGFDTFVGKGAQLDPRPAAEFLRKPHKRPFLAVASFLGPHEICQWSRKQKVPGDQLGNVPALPERPPVRPNSESPVNETDIMAHMRKSYQAHKLFPVGDYTEDDWRRHIWGYYRLIERVDGYVGTVMEALREGAHEENTVVVFLSDHGDCHGAHRWNQKTVFYDESARVPFIISQKGTTPAGTCDVLLNTGVDLMPTICDFAGIDVPTGLPGKSLKAAALDRQLGWQREYVVSENHMVQCVPVDGKDLKPHGRMVRSDRYKYCLYSEGDRRESLVDMVRDPGEMVNQAGNPALRDVLLQHRVFLKEHAERNGDAMASQMLAGQ